MQAVVIENLFGYSRTLEHMMGIIQPPNSSPRVFWVSEKCQQFPSIQNQTCFSGN